MRHRQRGMGMLGYMFLAVIVGLLITVIATVVPPYLDFYSIDRSIRDALKEVAQSNASVTDFRKSLSMQMQVQGVSFQSPDDLSVEKDGSTFNIEIKYDVQRPLMGNVDMLFHFHKSYTSDAHSD